MNSIVNKTNHCAKRWITTMLCCIFACMSSFADDVSRKDTTKTDTIPSRDGNPTVMITPSTPASPQAEAFQRVGEFSMNNASGVPDIGIPLYEIDHHGYKIPITLRYIATPIRPGYNYDVTGFGWSLSVGSCISRTIASAADENFDFNLSENIINSNTSLFQFYRDTYNNYNYQRDLFKCVLPNGESFQFYMSKNNSSTVIYTKSNRKSIKITAQTNYSTITGFTVTDDSGVIYTFNIAETSTNLNNMASNVAWYLSRIDLPNSNTPIYFEYGASIRQQHLQGLTEKVITLIHDHPIYSSDNVYLYIGESNSPSRYTTKLLTRIGYGNESVTFSYKNGTAEQEYNYLSKMTVTGFKEYRFSYYSPSTLPSNTTITRLKRLVVAGVSASPDSMVYSFTYRSIAGFSGTDHWGYYTNDSYVNNNFANMNFYFECDANFNNIITGSNHITYLGLDPDGWCPYKKYRLLRYTAPSERRHALSPDYHYVLKSITYPTGGRTEFVFENHKFVTATDEDGNFVRTKRQRRVIEGGGFRIRTITNYTSDNKVADIRQYRYGPTFKEANQQNLNLPVDPSNTSDKHIGFGEPVVDPNILSYSHFSSSGNLPTQIYYMLLGLNPAGQRTNFANPFDDVFYSRQWRFDVQFSPVFFQSLVRGRNGVVYPEITIYYGDVGYDDNHPENTAGKTVFKFDIYGVQNDSSYYQCPQYYGNTLDFMQHTATREHPIERSDYAYDGFFKIYRKESYTYQISGGSLYDYVFKNTYSPGWGDNALLSTLFQSRYLMADSYLPTEKTVTEYYNTGSITTTETTNYTSNDLIESHSVTGNKLITTSYTYPGTSSTGGGDLLYQKNMMTTVMQSTTRTENGSQQLDISGSKADYATFNTSQVLPSKSYRLNTSLNGSSFEQDLEVKSYTPNGNPIEVADRSGMTTIYLWSYNDRYLVAEIKNATLSQVSNAVSTIFGTTIDGLAVAGSPSPANLRNLRNNANLSGAMVTTWTYTPLIGVTSQTDPSGQSTFYDYDGLGRLKEVYRYEGNSVSSSNKRILNQYTYHTITN